MKVGDLMTPDVEVVAPGDTLKTAARLMADLHCETLPIGENNRLIGTITGCDIALQVVAAGRDPEQTMVCQAMSADVLYCYESESAHNVLMKMRDWWVQRVPVVDPDKRLLGTVSLGDLTPPRAAQAKPNRTPSQRRAPPADRSRRSIRMAVA